MTEIARRAMLAAMGGLPFSRPDQLYQPPPGGAQIPGARGLVRASRVIIGPAVPPGSGLYVYSPAVSAGDLIASIAAAAGFDSSHNAVLAGIANYNPVTFKAVALNSGTLAFYSAASEAGSWNLLGQIIDGLWQEPVASGLNLQVGGGPAQVQLGSTLLTVGVPELITAGTTTKPVLDVLNANSPTGLNSVGRITAAALGDPMFGLLINADTNPRFIFDTQTGPIARFRMGSGAAVPDINLARAATGQLNVTVTQGIMALLSASLDIGTVGQGLQVAEGTNAKQGTATLAAGTATVANTAVTANSRIFLTSQVNGVTGALRVSARTAGTSFVITSSVAADAGLVAYEIFEPG